MSAALLAAADSSLAPFSAMQPGSVAGPWELVELRGEKAAEFAIVDHAGERVLEARANSAVAALAHAVDVPVGQQTLLNWRWKVSAFVEAADIRAKKGDDYPARVYVTFARDVSELSWLTELKLSLARVFYGADVPTAAICYVWDKDSEVGLSVPNAYTDTVQMIVVRNGESDVDTWMPESRDVYADYQRAFGAEPPPVSSVIVGVDTDNTGEEVTAWFGDLYFSVEAVVAVHNRIP